MKKIFGIAALFLVSLVAKGVGNELKYIGMPVGGICTGQVYLGGDGQLWYWDVFNIAAIDPGGPGDRYYLNPLTQEKKFEQGFGLTIKEGDRVHMRSLNRNGFSDITFDGQYPIGKVFLSDPTLPVSVHLQAFSPFIPGDADNSGLPLTVVQYTVTNDSAEELEVEISGWLQNMAGFQSGSGMDDMHENKALMVDNSAQLICTISDKYNKELADWGSMSLTLLDKGQAFAKAAHPKGINVYSGVANTTNEKIALGEKLVGAVSGKASLKKGESKTFTYLLSWYFPNIHLWDGAHHWKNKENLRHYYASKFTDAAEVSNYVAKNRWLLESTRQWNKTWYNSSLPKWFLDRTFVNVSTLATTAAVRFDDLTDDPENEGRFYTYEGVYLGEGTCTHVFHYEQALGRVFPNLARQLREQIDLGLSYKEDGVIGYRGEFSGMGSHDGRGYAVDGQAGTIMRIYREHTMAPDNSFLERNWPKIKHIIQYMIDQDKEKTGKANGILEGIQYNTLDRMWYGKISWLSGLYAASLRAGSEMAKEMGDKKFEKTCSKIAELAYENISAELFDGEYFIQKLDQQHLDAPNSNMGCHTDQLLGQYWSSQVGLGNILPEEQVKTALRSIMKYNFVENYGKYLATAEIPIKRWYADDNEAGIIMCTFPKGGAYMAPGKISNEWEKLVIGYFSEIWTGQEHQLAATLIAEGLTEEAMKVEKALHARYSPDRRNPYNEIEYGNHYTRAMSGYAPFVSASGFICNGPNGVVGFNPKINPENFKSAFIAAEGWGSFLQKRGDNKQVNRIRLNYGKLKLNSVEVNLVNDSKITSVLVDVDDKKIDAKFKQNGQMLTIDFEGVLLSVNQEMTINIQ